MNPYFAVFNSHIHHADKRARIDVLKKFGKQKYTKEFKPFIKAGIMSIFQTAPTPITKYYVDRVTKYVNEKTNSKNTTKKRGWKWESARHALARKGIKTGRKKKTPNKLPTFKYKNRTYVIDQRLNEVRSFEIGKKPITLSGAKGNELIGKAAKVYGKKWVKIKNY